VAHFMGTVRGTRGEASRLGSPKSGLQVKANGWRSGVRVRAFVDADGRDCFQVHVTGGSGYGPGERLIATVHAGIVDVENGERAHRIEVESHFTHDRLVAQDGRWES
jgi:hypothetical protein